MYGGGNLPPEARPCPNPARVAERESELTRRGGAADLMSFPWAASMAFSLAAAAAAAPVGSVGVAVGGAWGGLGAVPVSGPVMSHFDRRFFFGGPPSGSGMFTLGDACVGRCCVCVCMNIACIIIH